MSAFISIWFYYTNVGVFLLGVGGLLHKQSILWRHFSSWENRWLGNMYINFKLGSDQKLGSKLPSLILSDPSTRFARSGSSFFILFRPQGAEFQESKDEPSKNRSVFKLFLLYSSFEGISSLPSYWNIYRNFWEQLAFDLLMSLICLNGSY